MAQARQANGGPPYVNTSFATVGGQPNIGQDVPLCAVLIAVYLAGAIANMSVYQANRRKGHRFLMSWAMFGFCMSRVGTCVLRLVWATRPANPRIEIAALIFTNIGILAVYIVVLLLALRVFRATHPKLGWNRPLSRILSASYILLLIALLLTVAFTILTFYTLSPTLRTVALWIQRSAILYMLLFNAVALVLVLLSLVLRRPPDHENFGTGKMRTKLIVLGTAIIFCLFIASFRTGISWSAPRPASNPPWYDTKAAFYVILFGFEIIIVYLFLFARFDKMFWVPNGCTGPGDYSRVAVDGSAPGKTAERDRA